MDMAVMEDTTTINRAIADIDPTMADTDPIMAVINLDMEAMEVMEATEGMAAVIVDMEVMEVLVITKSEINRYYKNQNAFIT